MASFVALLRAVNVGGTGKLPMQDLVKICEEIGFRKVKTYIASGNVMFESSFSEARVRSALEDALVRYAGKPVGVIVRTAAEMAQILSDNPFKQTPTKHTMVIFLNTAPPRDELERAVGKSTEQIELGKREIYAFYPLGIADSKLRLQSAKVGTARNINTVSKLTELMSVTSK